MERQRTERRCRGAATALALWLSATTVLTAAEAAGPLPLSLPEAAVTGFQASADADGQVSLHWSTAYEVGSGVFLVLRRLTDGGTAPVGSGYLRLRGGDDPCVYVWPDAAVRLGERAAYALVFIPQSGSGQTVAEWEGVLARPISGARSASPATTASALSETPVPLDAPPAWMGNGPRVRPWSGSLPADRVRLSLREPGLYRVSAAELAVAGGWDAGDLAAAIAATNLAVSCRGVPVAWLADGDALLFHGLPADTRYAPENVYWVQPGPGAAMGRRPAPPPPVPVTNAWFMDTVRWPGTNYLERLASCSLADSPASFLAYSSPILAGENKAFAVTLPECATGTWSGTVTVNLLSMYEVGTDTHQVRLSLGGLVLDTATWSNEQFVPLTAPFSSTNLSAGVAEIALRNIAPAPPWYLQDYTRFFPDSLVFTFARHYLARGDALRCTGGDGNLVAVAGFETNDIVVLDVTVPGAPVVVEAVEITRDGESGAWSAAFAAAGAHEAFLAVARPGGLRAPAIRGARDTDWSLPGAAPQYAILVPPEGWRDDIRAVLQPLADFRNAQGLRTAIIDVETLYNAYSDGLADPWAIRQFCAATRAGGLRYLLLAGSGSLDYRFERLSVNDFPACLIPSPVAGQQFPSGQGRIATVDAALGDADGDGLPDVAVGRLPTSRTNEMDIAVRKTITYEGALAWKRQASVAADWDSLLDKYYPFAAGCDRLLAPLAAAGRLAVTHYVYSQSAGETVRNSSLFPALLAGSGLFHFFGHSSNMSLGNSTTRLLYRSDIVPSRWQRPPIFFVMGCIPNRWQSMTTTVSILPYGLFAEGTGFAAALGSTGDMLPTEGEALAVALLTESGGSPVLRLGDVVLRGLRQAAASQPFERLMALSLIGDPALVFRHDVTSTGTAVSWLADRGLAAPNADLADPDQDGWPTWTEYRSGTDPLACRLRITGACLRGDTARTLVYESASNTPCLVQSATRLDGAEWQVVPWRLTNAAGWNAAGTPIPPQGPLTTVAVPATPPVPAGFYRLRGAE